MVANSVVEAKNIVPNVPIEPTVHSSESPKGVVTRKGYKGEQKEVLKNDSEEEIFNVVCVRKRRCLKMIVKRISLM